jgi:hypothetical protein
MKYYNDKKKLVQVFKVALGLLEDVNQVRNGLTPRSQYLEEILGEFSRSLEREIHTKLLTEFGVDMSTENLDKEVQAAEKAVEKADKIWESLPEFIE